jgi:prolyl-tRNA synthetase
MNLTFQDEHGGSTYPQMGCYGVGLGRLMDAVVRAHHDERGIAWPAALAPFKAYLMTVGKSLSVKKIAQGLAAELGDQVLYDDRDDSPGVKFTDADLIGLPLRLVVATRHLSEGREEVRSRRGGEPRLVPVEDTARLVQQISEPQE